MIRTYEPRDLKRLLEIHEKYHKDSFEFPDLESAFAHIVLEKDGELVAFGMVRLLVESIMLLDLGLSTREKGDAVEQLLLEADFQASRHGFTQNHVFVQGPFAEALVNHYGFRRCKGEALVRETNNG